MARTSPSPIDGAQHLLTVLTRLGNQGEWSGSQAMLAKECGVSVRTLARRLVELKADGRITVTGKPGTELKYAVQSQDGDGVQLPARINRGKPEQDSDDLCGAVGGSGSSRGDRSVLEIPAKPSVDSLHRKHRKRVKSSFTSKTIAMVGALITTMINAVMPAKPKRGGFKVAKGQLSFNFEADYAEVSNRGDEFRTGDRRSGRRNPVAADHNECGRGENIRSGKLASDQRDLCGDDRTGRASLERDRQKGLSRSSRAGAASINPVNPCTDQLVSVATVAHQAGARRADQLRARGPAQVSPPDSICSMFKLPRDTTGIQLRDPRFIQEHVFEASQKLGIVTVDEEKHVFALVGYVLRNESKTPARLLTWILRGGKRINPWRADLAEQDWAFAAERLRQIVPKSLARRSGGLFGSEVEESEFAATDRKKRESLAALKSKYANIAGGK
jgi:hypothetical protein